MSTQFSVTLGSEAYGYGREPERSFDISVYRLGDTVNVHFFFQGSRHHVGTLKTNPEIARWLAHALLATVEGADDVRISSVLVRDDRITRRLTRDEAVSATSPA